MRNEPDSNESTPKLYGELATWWPLLSAPGDYAEEAAFARRLLREACHEPQQTMLELGCGGGNNASHLKADFRMTLVDRSRQMLAVSERLNPECEHIVGDMRSVRLGRVFDTVFVHDAVMYMTTEGDLGKAMETAYSHCRPGGAALFVPDHVRESFQPTTRHGGHDGDGRALRYLEWVHDPDERDTVYVTDFAFLLKGENGSIKIEYDRHICGLFPRAAWIRLLGEVGFQPRAVRDSYGRDLFLAQKSRGHHT